MNHTGSPASTTAHHKPRCIVYVDGFNWYYGIFRERPAWKWINLQTFFEELRHSEEVVGVKFFTALVDEGVEPPTPKKLRMMALLAAFQTLPKVSIIRGRFKTNPTYCQASCGLSYNVSSEKETDVNIAVTIMHDAIEGSCDRIVLVSGDSDMIPVFRWLQKHRKTIKRTVYVPSLPEQQKYRRNDELGRFANECGFLPIDRIQAHLLPETVQHTFLGNVECPELWKRKS